MRQFTGPVIEIATTAGHVRLTCAGGPSLSCAPGQFLLARSGRSASDFLGCPLFPSYTEGGALEFLLDRAHPLADLQPGAHLDLIGPCGRGFTLGPRAARLLLVAASPIRLVPLVQLALQRSLALTYLPWPDISESVPGDLGRALLPPAVEVLGGALTPDALRWADLLAADLPDAPDFARRVRALAPAKPRGFVQALITPPLPCGTGACQACWVDSELGHKLACREGPVFLL